MEDYDAIVVGAGPGGLMAAKTLAEKGFNTLCLDRKQEIGPPKRCAEGLGGGWFQRCGLKPEKEWAVQDIYGAVLYSPGGKSLELRSSKVAGYVLERKIFEKDLARYASFAGARIRCKAHVEKARRENGKVVLDVNEFDDIKQYRAPLIVAADGIDSRTGRMLGMKTHNKLIDIDSGFQYEMSNIDGYDENMLHLYFGTEVAPRGYCLTPESEVVAKNSVKAISQFQGGEEVLTLEGWHKVEATSVREYNGVVFDITPRMVNKKVGLTAEHEVYAWNKSNGFGWKKAKDLIVGTRGSRGKGDYLVFPQANFEKAAELNISEYYAGIRKNGFIYPKGKNQFGSEFPYKHGIKEKIALTNHLLYLMGFFVAEGSTNSNGIILSNTNKEFINRLGVIGKEAFGFGGSVWAKEGKKNPCYQLHFASKILKEVFGKLFGVGAHNKKIPPLFFGLSEGQKTSFLKGYYDGDGTIEKSSEGYDVLSFTTVSKHLANDLWVMFASMHIVAFTGINKKKNAFKIKVRGKQLEKLGNTLGKLNYGKSEEDHGYKIIDGNICLGIRKKENRDYSGPVYDLQTNGSFCVPFAVHNCWIFPKRERTANVGIGIGAYVEKTARYYLDKWIASQPNIAKGSIIEVNGSGIPVGGFMENMVADNLMLVGDAAHQVDPIHGGGIGIAMEAAMIASNVAAEVRDRGEKFTQQNLSAYNDRWYQVRGNQLKRRLKGRHLLEKLTDKDFDILAGALTAEECLKIADGEFDSKERFFTLTKKLVQHPGLVGVMTKYLSPATPEESVTGNAPSNA